MTLDNDNKTEKTNHEVFLLRIKELLPIISVVMVFLGYWNLDSYYGKFGIDIYNYVTASEILLSFLPIVYYILLSVITLILITVFFIFLRGNEYSDDQPNGKEEVEITTLDLVEYLRRVFNFFTLKTYKKDKSIVKNMISMILDLISLAMNALIFLVVAAALIMMFTSIYRHNYNLTTINDGKFYLIVYAIVIILALRFLYSTIFEKVHVIKQILDKYDFVIAGIILLLVLINASNSNTAEKILQKKSNLLVTFTVDEKDITTDSNLVYIGTTQNYLFLRKLKQKTNVIYKMTDIKNLEIIDTK